MRTQVKKWAPGASQDAHQGEVVLMMQEFDEVDALEARFAEMRRYADYVAACRWLEENDDD